MSISASVSVFILVRGRRMLYFILPRVLTVASPMVLGWRGPEVSTPASRAWKCEDICDLVSCTFITQKFMLLKINDGIGYIFAI
jgi:hypothetical protein